MTPLRKLLVSLGLGALITAVSLPLGVLLGLMGLTKVAMFFVWPFLVLKPLIPCLPLGSPDCEGDAFVSGIVPVEHRIGGWRIRGSVVRLIVGENSATCHSRFERSRVRFVPRQGGLHDTYRLRVAGFCGDRKWHCF
jgi:hypothetical protein